jgi:hypothetical protein
METARAVERKRAGSLIIGREVQSHIQAFGLGCVDVFTWSPTSTLWIWEMRCIESETLEMILLHNV